VLHVALHVLVVHFAANETFGVKNGIFRVRVEGIFSAVTNKSFVVGETDPGRSYAMTLIVGDDFHTTPALYTNA
jgi:hypothetical protein